MATVTIKQSYETLKNIKPTANIIDAFFDVLAQHAETLEDYTPRWSPQDKRVDLKARAWLADSSEGAATFAEIASGIEDKFDGGITAAQVEKAIKKNMENVKMTSFKMDGEKVTLKNLPKDKKEKVKRAMVELE